jgi:nucleotide-binding universal stress UspA family protein
MVEMPTAPFCSVLVPYDGSEPSRSALAHAISLMQPETQLFVLTAVDEMPIISESATSMVAYDPTEMFEALDNEGKAELADAVKRCAEAHVAPKTELVHDTPLAAILAASTAHACDLIVMGTHGRTGLARLFLGSTTAGVLRESTVPVLVVR